MVKNVLLSDIEVGTFNCRTFWRKSLTRGHFDGTFNSRTFCWDFQQSDILLWTLNLSDIYLGHLIVGHFVGDV